MSTYRRTRRRPAQAADPAAKPGAKPKPGAGAKSAARHADVPRRTAYDVLAAVEQRDAYANLLLPRLLAERGLTGRDAGLATELAYGTLRGLGTYDAVLAACSDRPLDKLDPPVLQVLRLGTHQLLATRVGDHAAVATSVDLARAVAGPRVSGYVNAVLRRVAMRDAGQWLTIVAPARDVDPDGYLAVRHSHPRWIVAAYRDALGPDAAGELEATLAAGNERPHVTMATLPGGAGRDDVMPDGAEPGRWSPYAFTLPGGDPSPLVASGKATVQDEASQLAAIALTRATLDGVQPAVDEPDGRDRTWLDMCAGPGGKARMLAGLASMAGANLVAADVHPHRARLVGAALAAPAASAAARAELAVLVADGRVPPWRDGAFDRILVDVPCSGLGALRRRPEARWRKSEADLSALGDLQRALLRSAIAAARPGGVIAYVTCSPVPAETSDVIASVCGNAPPDAGNTASPDAGAGGEVDVLDAPAMLPGVPGLRARDPRFAQFWPHRHGTDAIFIALLRRR